MKDFIPVNEPLLEGNEKKYLNECIDTGWISSEGKFVKEFEAKFSSYCNRKYGVAVSSGTSALEIAFKALELPAGSEVIMPSFTIIACATAVIKAGLRPVFVDCEIDTWNTNIEHIKEAYTEKTSAILLVHLYGLPVDIDPILNFAKEKKLKVIEDAAEMHGQTYNGKPCGSFGDISIFSFYANKLITTGEGGMLVTDDENLYARSQYLKNQCFVPERRFLHYELGNNYRMTNTQAAIGLAQLERIENFIGLKHKMGALYQKLLSNVEHIKLPIAQTSFARNIYWVFGIVLTGKLEGKTQIVTEKLKSEGIGTRPFFWPMHQQPALGETKQSLPNSEFIAKNGFYLPSSLNLTESKIERISQSLIEVIDSI